MKVSEFNKPFNKIVEHSYVDAKTGRILNTFKTRQFWEWTDKAAYGPSYVLVREYRLDQEEVLNPGFHTSQDAQNEISFADYQ